MPCFCAIATILSSSDNGGGAGRFVGSEAGTPASSMKRSTPAEKFAWRPAPGVRSISEVYMHIAAGNLFLLEQAGVKAPDLPKLPKDPEKTVTAKADVIQWLRTSQDAVKSAYQTADRQKHVQFFGKDALADGVFLRILVHNNEHMGQSIAYARMNGIVPPWSR